MSVVSNEQLLTDAVQLGNVIVLSVPGVLCEDQRKSLRSQVSERFPHDEVIVLEEGCTIERFSQKDQLLGIEAKQDLINGKLDALFDLLASGEDGDALPLYSLDGELLSAERDTTQAL